MHLTHSARNTKPLRVLLLAALAMVPLSPGSARGDEKDVCVRAVERAQVARLDGKLRRAREGFVICARPVCPDAIREDCTRWVGEVDASLPSVVFEAVWADGRDVTGMTVRVDGQIVTGSDAGRAVPLDPGEHSFRFEVVGAAAVEAHNVIREGEKNRILQVTFTPVTAPEAAAAPGPLPAAPTTPAPADLWRDPGTEAARTPGSRGPVPPLAWVLGGVGLLSFGGFAYLGLSGTGQLDSLRATCVHTCNPSDVNAARNQILAGDILGIVGLAATGVAAWLVLARPSATTTAAAQ
jgi:hypothetical protein